MEEYDILKLWSIGFSIQKISDIYFKEFNKRKSNYEQISKKYAYSYVERIIFNNIKMGW